LNSPVAKRITASLLSNVWLVVLLLLLTPLYIRFLGIEIYGLIGFYASWIAILGILDMGISTTVTREIAWRSAREEECGTIPTLFRSLEVLYWGIILVIGVLLLSAAWIFGADWFQTKGVSPEVVRDALILMAVSLIFQVPSGLYTGGLIGLQRQVQNSGLLVGFGTLRGIGAVIVLWKISPDIRAFFIWQIIVSILQISVMRWSLLEKVTRKGYPARYSSDILKSVKGFAGGMTLITALSLIVSQADKMILSRVVSMEEFGYYMLAWSVASGLMLVAMPLVQTYAPLFTRMISINDNEGLSRHARLAFQLMSVLVIPPAAIIVFLSEPILFAWLGNPAIAAGSAPVLAIMVIGTMLVACSYPMLNILYSKKQLRPVIYVQMFSLAIILPLLVIVIIRFGITGAAFSWVLFGSILYISYGRLALKELCGEGILLSMLKDFIIPGLVSFILAAVAGVLLSGVEDRLVFATLLLASIVFILIAVIIVCKDLRLVLVSKLKGLNAK